MSDEKFVSTATVTVPAAEYHDLKNQVRHHYGQAESAERQANALQAKREAESVAGGTGRGRGGRSEARGTTRRCSATRPPGCG